MSTELVSRRFDNGLLDVEGGVKGRENRAAAAAYSIYYTNIVDDSNSFSFLPGAFKQFIRIYASCWGSTSLIGC